MNSIVSKILSADLDITTFLNTSVPILLGILLLGLVFRFIFGKKSALNRAVSSAIAIVFINAVMVILHSTGSQFAKWIPPLPFVSISGDNLILFSFSGADYIAICGQLLSMMILSFLVNIVDGWLPVGKGVFGWLFFRVLTVLVAACLHFVSTGLLTAYLPEGIVTYAPPILLGLLILMLLTGALKFLVGAILSTVNPLIAALYTFFFANIVGKQISKAVLTTAILSALVILLQKMGMGILSIAAAGLMAYLPFLLLLILIWFVIRRLL